MVGYPPSPHRTVFLVQAHAKPETFGALCKAVAGMDAVTVVHVDAKTDIAPFRAAAPPGVAFTSERTSVIWGHWSQVHATLILLRESMHLLGDQRAHLVLISGDSFPLVDVAQITRFFAANPATQYYNIAPMPAPQLNKPMWHLTRRMILAFDPRNGRRNFLRKALNRVVPLNARRGLGGLRPMCGSSWWAFSDVAVRWILDFVDSNPGLVRYFAKTRAPDEKFFQTIIHASPYAEPRTGAPMFTDFTRPTGPFPALVDDAMVSQIASWDSLHQDHTGYGEGPRLFARKLDQASTPIQQRLRDEVWPRSERLVHAAIEKVTNASTPPFASS